jgi:hypothetical protein
MIDERKGTKLKLRNSGRVLVGTMAIAATLTMTACSSGGDEPAATTTTAAATTSATAPTGDLPPVPTAADLNAELQRGLDPNVPVSEKVGLVQGAEADPDLITKVADAARANNATVTVNDVTDLGDGTLSANGTITVNGQANPLQVSFVAEDGVWKLSNANACQIVSLAQITSPACPS